MLSITNAITATNAAPADNIEVLAKGGYEEEAVDGTAGADRLVDPRWTERWIC